jgi:hypothetical protein
MKTNKHKPKTKKMKKLIPLGVTLLKSIGKSLPLVNSARKIVEEVKEKKSINVERLIWFAVEFAAVIGVLWIAKHFNVTVEDILNLLAKIGTLGLV